MAFPLHASPDPTLGDLKKAAREVIEAIRALYRGPDSQTVSQVERDINLIYAATSREYGLSEATLREAVQMIGLA